MSVVNRENSNQTTSYHIPNKVSQPVDDWPHSTDELQMLGLADSLLDQENHKAGRDKGHGKDDTDGDQNVHGGGHSEQREKGKGDKLHFDITRCIIIHNST